MLSFFSTLSAIIIGFYLVLTGYLYFFQRKIIYAPSTNLQAPQLYDLNDVDVITLTTADKVNITAWHIKSPQKEAPTLLYFHGNAGHLGDRAGKFRTFQEHFNIYALSYRGYGSSEGSPTEEGLYHDASALIEYAKAQGIKEENMIFFGESLGSGVATEMALRYRPKAIVLEAPYRSIAKRGAELYPWIPIDFLLKDKFESENKIANVKSPVIVFHGELDQVMPIAHGRKIFELATSRKEGHFYPNVAHTDFDAGDLVEKINTFIENR